MVYYHISKTCSRRSTRRSAALVALAFAPLSTMIPPTRTSHRCPMVLINSLFLDLLPPLPLPHLPAIFALAPVLMMAEPSLPTLLRR